MASHCCLFRVWLGMEVGGSLLGLVWTSQRDTSIFEGVKPGPDDWALSCRTIGSKGHKQPVEEVSLYQETYR